MTVTHNCDGTLVLIFPKQCRGKINRARGNKSVRPFIETYCIRIHGSVSLKNYPLEDTRQRGYHNLLF